MAARTRRVVFGRINRRNPGQETLQMRDFAQDMAALANSRMTEHLERGTADRPSRRWVAADMNLTPDETFLTGVIGFSEQQQQVMFDDESFSWMKGQKEDSDSASEQTIVPFAVDLRPGQRWVAFATTARLKPQTFRGGFERVLNEAVAALGFIPTAWEFDLVTSKFRIEEWLHENPLVHQLTRTLKFSNPGKDLDEDRRQMRALAANRKTEEFKAARGQILDINSPAFQGKLEGTETGDLDVILHARGSHGVRDVKFNTRESVDESKVEDFGMNLENGIEVVLRALREYVQSKQGAAQPELN